MSSSLKIPNIDGITPIPFLTANQLLLIQVLSLRLGPTLVTDASFKE